jgi:AraC-like DNA-binding protein
LPDPAKVVDGNGHVTRRAPGASSGRAVRFAAAMLREEGMPVGRILRSAGLDPAVVQDPDARVSPRAIVAFWDAAVKASGDERLGLRVGAAVRPAALDALGYVFRASATLGDGMRRLSLYYRFMSDVLGVRVVPEGRQVRIVATATSPAVVSLTISEFRLSAMAREARLETGDENLDPLQVDFAYPAPSSTEPHRRFFRCPVRFSCETNSLLYPAAAMDRPFRHAEPELRDVLERCVRDVISRLPLPHGSVRDGVSAVVAQRLSRGRPTAASVARNLGLSERSLRRALQAEGTSLRALLEEVRRQEAERHLRDGLPTTEVAFLLGFADASAFHRSFQRWTGQTPGAFRAAEARRRP